MDERDGLSGQYRLFPRDAERPSREWLAMKVGVLLRQFWQDQESDAEYTANLATWCDCLSDLPWEAINWAIMDRLKANDRRKPIIGEIRDAALSRLEPLPALPPSRGAFEPDPNIVPISRERMEEIAKEIGAEGQFKCWFPNKGDAG